MPRPLRKGQPVPEFEVDSMDGGRVSRASMLGEAYVLFFYPKDETPGCIAQGCAFRDEHEAFTRLHVRVLGVSRDSIESHRSYAKRHGLPFPLLSDRDGRMHAAFGATMLGGMPRRVSYLVDAQGVVAGAFDSHLRPAAHAAKMAEAARALLEKK